MPENRGDQLEVRKQISFRNVIELSGLVLALAACLAVTIADLFGWISEDTFLGKRVEEIVLGLLAIVGLYIVTLGQRLHSSMSALYTQHADAMRKELEGYGTRIRYEVRNSIENIGPTIASSPLREFKDDPELLTYLLKRMREAEISIDDLSWAHAEKTHRWSAARGTLEKNYEKTIVEVSARLQYREIFILNRNSRLERFKRRIEENSKGYACALYTESNVPRIQFMVIDKTEAIFMSREGRKAFSIINPIIVDYISRYYEEIWANAERVRHANGDEFSSFEGYVCC